MRKLLLIPVLLICSSLGAQEAHVIALKSEDAAHARCAWERLQKAQKEWEQVQKDIEEDYLRVPTESKDASTTLSIFNSGRTYRKGFESGFQFSSDFKYIVPKPYQDVITGSGNLWNLGGSCWIMDTNGGGHYGPCGPVFTY